MPSGQGGVRRVPVNICDDDCFEEEEQARSPAREKAGTVRIPVEICDDDCFEEKPARSPVREKKTKPVRRIPMNVCDYECFDDEKPARRKPDYYPCAPCAPCVYPRKKKPATPTYRDRREECAKECYDQYPRPKPPPPGKRGEWLIPCGDECPASLPPCAYRARSAPPARKCPPRASKQPAVCPAFASYRQPKRRQAQPQYSCGGQSQSPLVNLLGLGFQQPLKPRWEDYQDLDLYGSSQNICPPICKGAKKQKRCPGLGLSADEDEDEFEELQRLVYEETDDANLAKKVLSKTESSGKSGYRYHRLGGPRGTGSNRDELDTAEEIQPEVAAAIMHTEEQGLPMGSAPSALYAVLFAEHHEDSIVPVGSAGPPPHQDLVIPLSAPRLAHHSMDVEDAALLASAVKNTTKRPKDCIFSEHLEKNGDKKTGNGGSGSSEFNPRKLDVWVGAVSSSTDRTDDSSSIAAKREFILEPQIPTHFTHVQLRGSRLPNWFPGFYHALPSSPELVNLSASPSRILNEAWQCVHPDNFSTDSTFIVNV